MFKRKRRIRISRWWPKQTWQTVVNWATPYRIDSKNSTQVYSLFESNWEMAWTKRWNTSANRTNRKKNNTRKHIKCTKAKVMTVIRWCGSVDALTVNSNQKMFTLCVSFIYVILLRIWCKTRCDVHALDIFEKWKFNLRLRRENVLETKKNWCNCVSRKEEQI